MENVIAAAQAIYTDDQRMLLENFRKMAEAEFAPLTEKYEALGHPPDADTLKGLFAKVEEFGLISGLIPEEDGGAGMDRMSYGILYEELARIWPDLAIAVLIQGHAAFALSLLGSPEQKEIYLKPLLRSERIACTCISEPEVGSNVREVKCRGTREGEKIFISGQKLWISNGAQSDFAIVVCNLDGGISMVIVDRDAGKYESRELRKLGLVGASTCELFFDRAETTSDHVLGQPGSGLFQTLKLFESARVFVGLTSIGIGQAALECAVTYAKDRHQHGKPIAGHQLIQGYLADMATQLDAARLLCQRGLKLLDLGVRCDTQTSMAKWYATEMSVEITGKAVQIHGGNGITKEFPVERHFRNAKVMPIPDGTTEIQKLVIGRNLTGVGAF
ncbi:acyl-CoA dehydrogenase family protein [Neoaquamicrobium sediminum]|uniref:Acyl-CoA dehydrogenase family protein n=1 Tax=Neoaquamicrobium sediminum TaxID=1849104 RepID=A0ABV3WYF0_9HYPH|nr:acyl-CoA dehydrogenase family protein [Mesorhizobium sediminum]MCV0398314.1 acyl-CoA dehydrogenase family protein [Rhizobiaceae bacterium]MCV0406682.1 acyl-CoA dehydrogenase family protein [Rhizobiaceae bacterium]NRC57117.1 acyl-CoA dehydrogenase [Mesorhizobium sediminum]